MYWPTTGGSAWHYRENHGCCPCWLLTEFWQARTGQSHGPVLYTYMKFPPPTTALTFSVLSTYGPQAYCCSYVQCIVLLLYWPLAQANGAPWHSVHSKELLLLAAHHYAVITTHNCTVISVHCTEHIQHTSLLLAATITTHDIVSGSFLALHAVLHPDLCRRFYNAHSERSCSAMAEWMMLEADLWNVDSLSSAFLLGLRAG